MKAQRTVSENELCNTSKVHGNGAEEVVITVQADETGWCYSTSQTAKGEDGGCVWDQEAEKTKEGRVGYNSR
jgi:hypothetical protein